MALGSYGGAQTTLCRQHLAVLGQRANSTMPLNTPGGAAAQLLQQEDFFFVSSPSPVFATSILVPDDTVVALSSAGVTTDRVDHRSTHTHSGTLKHLDTQT